MLPVHTVPLLWVVPLITLLPSGCALRRHRVRRWLRSWEKIHKASIPPLLLSSLPALLPRLFRSTRGSRLGPTGIQDPGTVIIVGNCPPHPSRRLPLPMNACPPVHPPGRCAGTPIHVLHLSFASLAPPGSYGTSFRDLRSVPMATIACKSPLRGGPHGSYPSIPGAFPLVILRHPGWRL